MGLVSLLQQRRGAPWQCRASTDWVPESGFTATMSGNDQVAFSQQKGATSKDKGSSPSTKNRWPLLWGSLQKWVLTQGHLQKRAKSGSPCSISNTKIAKLLRNSDELKNQIDHIFNKIREDDGRIFCVGNTPLIDLSFDASITPEACPQNMRACYVVQPPPPSQT